MWEWFRSVFGGPTPPAPPGVATPAATLSPPTGMATIDLPVTGDDAALVAAVCAAWDDELTRLVYADWLDERGDPRGEFLRVECRLHAAAADDPDALALRERLAELARAVDVRWHLAVCRVHVEPGPAHASPHRHPLNVAGPFYTHGWCVSCEAPEGEAPDLLAPLCAVNYTTHFVRQPGTAAEFERACSACEVCCVADLRYGGTDPLVIRRLGNSPEYCDHLIGHSPDLLPAPDWYRDGGPPWNPVDIPPVA